MSKGKERDLEAIVPESEENKKPEETKAKKASSAGGSAKRKSGSKSSAKKRRKRRQRRMIATVVIVVVVVLLALAVLAGYGLSRVRSGRQNNPAQDVEATIEAVESTPAPYDAFTEALTNENQQALEALAGENGYYDENANALLGEDAALVEAEGENAQVAEPIEAVVVAEFGDGEVLMSDEVLEAYSEQMNMYILSGYSEEEIAETLLDDVMQNMVNDRVLAAHAKELGVYELTDEDRAAIEQQAADLYAEYLVYYRENEVNDANMTEEEANAAAAAYLMEYEGVSYESLLADLETTWWETKLYDAVTADVTVDDFDLQATYDALLAEQKQEFEEYPDDYEFAQMNGETIVYNLPDYRAVKVLLLGIEDENTLAKVYELMDEIAGFGETELTDEEIAEREAELEAIYEEPLARAEEALEQLRDGADMDELILSIGADEGMREDHLRETGYYVGEGSLNWSDEFLEAAMALENIGDYSEPVRIEEGVCILQYVGDVPAGDVPMDDVREELGAEALEESRYEVYEAQVQTWIDEADPKYYPERMQ